MDLVFFLSFCVVVVVVVSQVIVVVRRVENQTPMSSQSSDPSIHPIHVLPLRANS
jgi:hypothetical protein